MSSLTSNPVSDERLRNTRAWAAARVGTLSGAEVIIAAIDEVFQLRAEISERKFFDNVPPASPEMIAEARRQGKLPPDETPAEPPIDWKAAYVEAIRQRDALQTDANRYRWLRDFTYVEAYWIDGAGGVDEIRLQGSVHFLDQAVDLERIKDAPRSPPKTPADPAPYTIDKGEPLC